MKVRTFFILTLIALASCTKLEIIDEPVANPSFIQEDFSTKTDEERGCAYVRIGMFNNFKDYTVTVTDLWVESRNGLVDLPQFGNNISSIDSISTSYDAPTWDNADTSFHCVDISGKLNAITVHFSLVLKSNDGKCTLTLEGEKYIINKSKTNWKDSNFYSYIIRLDAETLGLEEITFNPSVENFQDVVVNL